MLIQKVHFIPNPKREYVTQCGTRISSIDPKTTDRSEVTCERCKKLMPKNVTPAFNQHYNRQGEPITVNYSFAPEFREAYLDLWYEKNKDSWNKAYKEFDGVGNLMIQWYAENFPDVHQTLSAMTLKEIGATNQPTERMRKEQEPHENPFRKYYRPPRPVRVSRN